ncbi:MAG: PspC domain-containing protein [Bacteroidales bacterium]|nr:PspC domain-containing protein [Bacteroidales bacterium]
MKRTSTISLGGMNFNIDDDAYEMLNQYFIEISKRFPEDEKEEILRDIESRMAELFTFKMKDRNVINADDVNEVIDVIGHPDQFDDESGNSSEMNSSKENHAEEKRNFTGRSRKEYRKLYRNGTDKIIGGVASGLAAYFDLDPVVVRILFVVLAFASLGWGILIYLIFLIAMPEAITKAELLEMQGIEPSLENIDNFTQAPINPKRSSTFWNIIKAILIFIGIAIALTLAVCVLGIAIAIFVGLLTHTPGGFGSFIDIALLVCCGLFCLCPVIGIIVLCVRAFRNGERKQKWVGWTLLIIWILSLFGIIGFGIEEGKQGDIEQRLQKTDQDMGDNWTSNDSYTDYYYDDETTVDDVLDELDLNDENSDYDISISSAPGMGTNIHVSSTKKGKNISTTKNNTPTDTISQLQ